MSADAPSQSSLAALTTRIQVAQRSDEDAAAFFDDFATASQVGENLLIRLHDGDLVRGLEQALINRIEREDHLRREAIKRSVAQLRRDLSGSDPCSAVERIIIDRIIICWLAVQDAESRVIRTRSDAPQVAVQKRLDHAQNRLLAVIKALDHLRRKTPLSHRLAIQVVGDVHLNRPTAAPPAPVTGPTIELPASSEEIDHASTP